MKNFITTLLAILVAAGIILFIKSEVDTAKRQERITQELNEQGAELVKHARERAMGLQP